MTPKEFYEFNNARSRLEPKRGITKWDAQLIIKNF